MKKTLTVTIIFFMASVLALPLFAQPQRNRMGDQDLMRPSPTKIYLLLKANQKEYKITDKQLQQIKNLSFDFEEKTLLKKNELSQHHLELKKLLLDEEKMDYGKIRAALSKMAEIRQDMFIEGLKAKETVKNILTPEQQEALKAALKDHCQERGFFRRGSHHRELEQRGRPAPEGE